MKNKLFFFIAGVTALLAISCNKETTEVASSKANAKTEEVSFSVGISQEDTKAQIERTGGEEWTAGNFYGSKIWVKATDEAGIELSSATFTGSSTDGNVFTGVWTYPEKESTYSVFYPSFLGKDGIFDLRDQSHNISGGSSPGLFYALRGDVENVGAGEFPKNITLKPLAAVLQIFPDGEINLVAKDSKGAYVTGIDSEGEIISSSEISWEEAVLFSSRDWGSSRTYPGVVMVVVPAGEKLTFYNGTKEIRTTKDSGLKGGTVTNLYFGEEIKVNIDITEVKVDDYSATVSGKVQAKGNGVDQIAACLYYSETEGYFKDNFSYNGYNYTSYRVNIYPDEKGCFSVIIPRLTEGKTYYFIVEVSMYTKNYMYYYFSDVISFTTLEPKITVETRAPTYIGFNEAELDSYVITSTSEGPGSGFRYSSTATTREELIASGKACGRKLTGLEKGTTYYYIAVGSAGSGSGVPKKIAYGDVMSFTTLSSEAEVGEAVDLGLSVKWRSCNLGASSPTSLGKTYCWGETSEPLSGEKYNKYKGDGGKEVLDLEDDTAHYILGGNWRMPTYSEIEELKSKCTLTAITYYSSDGTPPHFIIRSNVPGHTDKYITLPAVGNTEEIRVWTSSLVPFEPYSNAYLCAFSSYLTGFNIVSSIRNNSKYYIRPVCDTEN